jgi:hypothetical protein
MLVKFNVLDAMEDYKELMSQEIMTLIENKEGEIYEEDNDVIDVDDDEAYYDVTFTFDRFFVTLEAVSTYNLTQV